MVYPFALWVDLIRFIVGRFENLNRITLFFQGKDDPPWIGQRD